MKFIWIALTLLMMAYSPLIALSEPKASTPLFKLFEQHGCGELFIKRLFYRHENNNRIVIILNMIKETQDKDIFINELAINLEIELRLIKEDIFARIKESKESVNLYKEDIYKISNDMIDDLRTSFVSHSPLSADDIKNHLINCLKNIEAHEEYLRDYETLLIVIEKIQADHSWINKVQQEEIFKMMRWFGK